MAGAALLGNSEIAGGMYVFGVCGGDYTVVCKHLEYKFLRPCFGPAEYRIKPKDDLHELVEDGRRVQHRHRHGHRPDPPDDGGRQGRQGDQEGAQAPAPRGLRRAAEAEPKTVKLTREQRLQRLKNREKRVGRASATFHVTPKAHHKAKAERAKQRTEPETDAP
jgi:hypothetical protein